MISRETSAWSTQGGRFGPRSVSGRGAPCAAFTLPELIIALTLLGAATAVMMPLMLSVSAQRRAAEQRQFALFQAENLLDRLLVATTPQTTQAELSQQLAKLAAQTTPGQPQLPDLEQHVTLTDRPEARARQLTVELRWRNHAGHFTAPVRLSGWLFAAGEKQP